MSICILKRIRPRLDWSIPLFRLNTFRDVSTTSHARLINSWPLRAHANRSSGRGLQQRRCLFGSAVTFLNAHVPTILFPPLLFVGLVITLWTQKCIMMILFQNKIIYMPGMPPFSRSEKLDDYTASCKPVVWEQIKIRSIDGTKLALCVGRLPKDDRVPRQRKVVILYFQG